MDHRLYFVLGDLFANVLVGSLIGALSWLLINPDWSMFIAMTVMMFIGMVAALVLWVPFSIAFGAMEVMIPLMLTGMLSGMAVSMCLSMEQMSVSNCFNAGALCGLVSIVFIWIFNNTLRGTGSLNWK